MRKKRPHDGFRSPGHREPYVHDLFDAQAARQPGRDAVVSEQERLTYGQLSQSANRLAHHLRELGVGPETLAGVCLERGPEAIRCLLAVLKAGGAYLPLDPALPAARLAQMCSQARPGFILAGRAQAAALPATGAQLLVLEELAPALAGRQVSAPVVRLHPDNAAYVICTSGSTGQPKAVAVSHGSLACVLAQLTREYRICAQDRVLQLASLSFDTSVEQALVTLLGGATLMLPAAGTVAPADLLGYLARQQVTVVDLTPAYWHRLLAGTGAGDDRLRSVRLMITGGDLADRADCHAARRAAPAARLLNAYGLTETTITSALFDVAAADVGAAAAAEPVPVPVPMPVVPVPAGTALPHAQLLVLDASLNPVPAGEQGEIYVGGCGIARGYLGRPDLTARRFVPNPHGAGPGGRMYRTGDLGRWHEDGNLEVIGRMDRQLKISGYRVEPVEIERALAGHPGVAEAMVTARVTGSASRQLVAYYTRRHGDSGQSVGAPPQDLPSEASLRSFLAARVPGFMIPAAFIAVDQLPAAPAGEPAPRAPAPAAGGPQGGYTPVQAGVSHLWSELLDSGPVSLDDDFFALGGDSLLAAEMLARARVMFGIGADHIRPLTRSLLRDPTLRGFAAAAQDARAGLLTAGRAASRADFTRDAELDHPISTGLGPSPERQRPREILLTGATGFLGIHLLRALTTATTARVHCLVRARDAAHARQRIVDTARRYEVDLDLATDRVAPVAGDLAAPALGLPAEVFSELARTVDVIHHAGALVNFIYPYEELRAANVTGTRELIRLAGLYRGIPVHYVSTTTVLAGFGAAGVRRVTESTPLAHADQLRMGYVETKFVAEELLRNAGRAGLPIAIYRPLDIGGDQRHGAWNTATEMCALIKFITDTGLAPDSDLPLDIVPVDICAAAISYISLHAGLSGRTYHLASPKHARLGLLVDRLRQHGFGIKEIAYEEWVDVLLEHAARSPGHPMSHFVPLFVDRSEESGLTTAELYLEHVFPAYTRTNTEQALRGSGITLPAVDSGLLDLNIAHLMASGYLRAPDEASG